MKVRNRYEGNLTQLTEFLLNHMNENINFDAITSTSFKAHVDTEMTEPEYNMSQLRFLLDTDPKTKDILTPEEQNAIEYAIGAIKTLEDMGVIK